MFIVKKKKKTGYDVSKCFAKQRAHKRNQANVNFCSSPPTKRTDIVVGVIQGIPVDILIDSGAIGVSLISNVGTFRQRTAERLLQNQRRQDTFVNENRHPPRVFQKDDMVFVIKYAQSKGKLDPGMRGPYRVIRPLANGRYELKLMAGGYGKTTYAAAQFLVPWRGEWTPDTCAAFFEGAYRSLCSMLTLCLC